jgi:single-stranded-DNA-specific exonuclease
MAKAVERILNAKAHSEKILIFGDRDVDGITGTALLFKYFSSIGFDTIWRLPEETEPYGLSKKALEEFAHNGGNLVITVDCGVANSEEINYANSLGLEVIVTDHHNPPEKFPAAFAIVNPKRSDSVYPFHYLAGCGVAYKLVSALRHTLTTGLCNHWAYSPSQEDTADLQLVALGTIGDIMPIHDENRFLVRSGLNAIMKGPLPGLFELLFNQGIAGRIITAKDIAWLVCPVINAAGRMGVAEKAARLFLEPSLERRDEIAREMIALNKERQKMVGRVIRLATTQVEANMEAYNGTLAFACDETIRRGITGLVATGLLKRYQILSLAASIGDATVQGSFRAMKGYDLRSVFIQCGDLMLNWGGHDLAMGFVIDKSKWDIFTERLKIILPATEDPETSPEETIEIDAELPHEYLAPDILSIVDCFEPYGEANNRIVFLARKLIIRAAARMGKKEKCHVKLTLDAGKYQWPAVYWKAADKVMANFNIDDTVDLVFSISRNRYRGQETPQIEIIDLRKSDA